MKNKEEETIKTIKGFDSNMQCRGKQYEVGQTYTEDGKPKVCEHGMHAISPDVSPLSVFNYYPPSVNGKPSRYCEVEASGNITNNGEKIAASKLTVGAEIGIPGIVKAHVEWVRQHITNEYNAEPGKPAVAGEYGSASAGYRGSASAGEYGSASAGYRGSASAGEYGSASAGEYGSASAGEYGSASAGEYGSASAGYSGSASAGNRGSASAGNRGSASAGEYGSASAGEYGSASAGYSGSASAGNSGSASAGYRGSASAGEYGSASAGEYGSAVSRGSSAVKNNGVAVARGNNVKVKGGIGALLVIAKENSGDYDIKDWQSAIVDGKTIKADTWYTVENGEWKEIIEEE